MKLGKILDKLPMQWLTLGVIVIGTFMAILDSSIVNIAIPKMMSVFNVGTDKIEWVLTAYMLTMGIVIPLTGVLSDQFGLKKMYIFSLTVFTIGSLLCGLSWDLSTMIISRVIQAIGGGMIMPISMMLVYKIIPREKIGLAMGFWGIAAMAAPAIGPTLGGYLIEFMDWKLIFNVNIPFGIIGVVLSILLLDEFKGKGVLKLDIGGALSSTICLFTFLLALNKGNAEGWMSIYIISLFITSFFSFIAFLWFELTHEEPLLDLKILKNFPFSLSLLIGSVTTIMLYGGIFMMPIYLQNLKNLSPLQAGILMFPSSLATALFMPISGKLFDKYGARGLVLAGLAILTFTTIELSYLSLDTSFSSIVWILVIRGAGLGLAMITIQTYGMSKVPKNQISNASALSSTIRQVSGALGIAVLTSIMSHQQTIHIFNLANNLNSNSPIFAKFIAETIQVGINHGINAISAKMIWAQVAYGAIMKQAAISSITDTFWVTIFMGLIGIALAFFITKKEIIND